MSDGTPTAPAAPQPPPVASAELDAQRAPLLAIDGLRTWIDGGDSIVRAVDAVDLQLGRGETLALLGESGCGKSMTALSVARLLPDAAEVVAGAVVLDGRDLLELPEKAMRAVRGARIGMIFQEPMLSLNPVMRIGTQVEEALHRHRRMTARAGRARALELLQSVGIPDAVRALDAYPFQLSGGMRQRVMIALALACDPELLIGDEPTTALDVTIQAQVLDLLCGLQRSRGMAMLLITHDLGVVAEAAQRVAVMYAGEIVEVARVEAFLRGPAHPYSRKLFDSLPGRGRRDAPLAVIRGAVPALDKTFTGCRFVDRCDHAFEPCRAAPPPLVRQADEHQVRCYLYSTGSAGSGRDETACASPASPRIFAAAMHPVPVPVPALSRPSPDGLAGTASDDPPQAPLLVARGLQVHFPLRTGLLRRAGGAVRAVDGVSLDLVPGRTLALVGESGCGKTTVGKALLRLVEPTGGTLAFDGQSLIGLGRARLRPLRARMQIVFQDPYASLNPRIRIGDMLEEGMRSLRPEWSAADRAQRILRLLDQVGLPAEARYRFPHQFSGGQRQRVAIARALSVEPQLVVCDEPTSALDVSVQAQILNLLRALQQQMMLSYLFITHNLGVVEVIADDIAVMYLGRIVERGPVPVVLARPAHPYTRALIAAVPRIDRGVRAVAMKATGDPPSPVDPPAGCHFRLRCPQAMALCAQRYPDPVALPDGQVVACHLHPAGAAG
jgi:peptide/nickel transport system ATP-binding protein